MIGARKDVWLGLCGGCLSVAVAIVTFVAQIESWETPEHPPLLVALFLGLAGFVAGVLVLAGLLKVVGSENNYPRSLLVWIFIGLFYGIFAPLVTGALLPPFVVLRSAVMGELGMLEMLSGLLDSLFYMLWSAVIQGFLGIPAGLLAGALLACSGWGIDMASASTNRRVATYGPLTIALALAMVTLGFVMFGPASLLSRLGWGPA